VIGVILGKTTPMTAPDGPFSLDRMVSAVEKVRQRLLRATAALEAAKVPYAVVGGNAVAAWVTRADEAAVRNTQDVNLLIRREDLEATTNALVPAGFLLRRIKGIDIFLDGPDGNPREALQLVFAREKIRDDHSYPAPDVSESEPEGAFRILKLPALIRMKLTSYRFKDRMHLFDLIDVGLIDQSSVKGLPADLAERLQELIDHPDS
jgi:hypothetical protein